MLNEKLVKFTYLFDARSLPPRPQKAYTGWRSHAADDDNVFKQQGQEYLKAPAERLARTLVHHQQL